MKMLKKAGAIAIAGAMALTLGTVSALAADETISLELGTIPEPTVADGVMTVKVPYTATGVDQVTLLAEIGTTANSFNDAIAYETTAYIDQESGDGEFEFKINTSRLQPASEEVKAVYINVKIGGTGIDTPDTGSIQVYKKEAPTSVVTKDMITGAVDTTITDAFGATGAKVVRLDVTDLVSAGKLDLTKQAIKIGNDYAYYTVTSAGKYKVLYLGTIADDATVVVENVADTDELRRVYDGDVSSDKKVTAADISLTIDKVLKPSTEFTEKMYISADVSADGKTTAADISQIIDKVLKPSTIFAVESK